MGYYDKSSDLYISGASKPKKSDSTSNTLKLAGVGASMLGSMYSTYQTNKGAKAQYEATADSWNFKANEYERQAEILAGNAVLQAQQMSSDLNRVLSDFRASKVAPSGFRAASQTFQAREAEAQARITQNIDDYMGARTQEYNQYLQNATDARSMASRADNLARKTSNNDWWQIGLNGLLTGIQSYVGMQR